jgi:hypothetical protein
MGMGTGTEVQRGWSGFVLSMDFGAWGNHVIALIA